MIDPSSSEEESDEDQNTHHGGGGSGGRGGGHVSSRRHPGGSSGIGPGTGGVASSSVNNNLAQGLTSSPGGHSQTGSIGSPNLHHTGSLHGQHGGRSGHNVNQGHYGTQQEAGLSGLDVPNLSSARNSLSPSMSATQDATNYAKSSQRPTSPSPSVASEKTEIDLQV